MTTERYELAEGYMEFAPEDGKWVHWSDYSKMRSAYLVEVHSLKSRIVELEKDAARYLLRLETIRALYPSAPSDIELDTAIDAAMQKD